MASCPSCGMRASIARLVAVSARRPYLCPACGARSSFEPRREFARGLVAVLCAALLSSVVAAEWPASARLALSVALVLTAIALSRLGLRLRPHVADDTSARDTPL